MNLPSLKIGNLVAKIPIIQGGMGIGVSMSSLAGNVSKHGAIGVISAAQPGYKDINFLKNPLDCNLRALSEEIKKARHIAPNGILGVNIMVAAQNYTELVRECVKEKIDLIISGAGLPSKLPELIKGSKTKIIPIVSSAKAAATITKLWTKRYDYLPDAIIVEGPKAGGHLGFSLEELQNHPNLEDLFLKVKSVLKPFEENYKKNIPVIPAGGIFDGYDIGKFLKLGASGVQMATRFVATDECDAKIEFKEAYINCNKEDISIVKSPVGMPGRALNNKFVKSLKKQIPVEKCFRCLSACNPSTTPYCISQALINSVNGNTDDGLIFAGENAYKLDSIIPVEKLINDLKFEIIESMSK